jgi:hypothetical protein
MNDALIWQGFWLIAILGIGFHRHKKVITRKDRSEEDNG